MGFHRTKLQGISSGEGRLAGEHIVRGTSTVVRKPRLELEGEELVRVQRIAAEALEQRIDIEALVNGAVAASTA